MPKRSRKPLATPQTPAERETADYGPKEQRRRVVIRERGDPSQPNRTIRRAEVYVIYHGLWADGLLTDAHHEAADRLAIAYEMVEGGASGAQSGASNGNPYGRWPVSARAFQAAADLRMAKDSLGLKDYLFALCVCALNRWPSGVPSSPKLAAALGKLATRWGME